MTPQQIDEIRDRLRSCPKCHGTGVIHVRVDTAGYMGSYTEESCYPCRARIVQSWPALLAEIDRLRAENHQAWSEGHAAAMGAMLDQVEQQRHEARAEVNRLTIERDAYRRAKQENDDRFMRERDEARAEIDRLCRENLNLKEMIDAGGDRFKRIENEVERLRGQLASKDTEIQRLQALIPPDCCMLCDGTGIRDRVMCEDCDGTGACGECADCEASQ